MVLHLFFHIKTLRLRFKLTAELFKNVLTVIQAATQMIHFLIIKTGKKKLQNFDYHKLRPTL